ncbi:hypothetical protein [Pseudomonas asiatica]|uniref:hypothetical protein n=1 Tax=Pseudomonas asiatica TaxID=2219225 RepID=UPI003877C48F
MMRSKPPRFRSGDRYESQARRVLIPQFRLLQAKHTALENGAGLSVKTEYETAEGENGYYPKFPVIIQGNGEPWRIANLYLTTKLQRENGYESRTFRGIADHLLNYLRFLEDENLDYLHLPKNNRLRVTFRYQRHLIELRDQGAISVNTASARINAIANFYRSIIDWHIIQKEEILHPPFESLVKRINITSGFGTQNTISIKSHNLAIKAPQSIINSEHIRDGGSLRPLEFNDQVLVLKALLSSSREYQLLFYFALFTGARLQTTATLRVSHLRGNLDSDGNLRLNAGAGTFIDTKRGAPLTLLVPGWLVNDMIIYSRSPEAIKRRNRSFYGDSDENYLFLSKSGVPYYTSKKELYDRQNPLISRSTILTDRASEVSVQDGGAIRQHIYEILIPRIREEKPDFQSFTFHDLRATFGMNLLESQLKHLGDKSITSALDYVQQRMGHRDKATTMQYLNYKSRLEWKLQIENEFEQSLFKHVNLSNQHNEP